MENKNFNARKLRFRSGLLGAAAFIFVLGFLSGVGSSGMLSSNDLPGFTPGKDALDRNHLEGTITPTTGEVLLVQTVTTLRLPRPAPTTVRPPRPPRPTFDCGGRPCTTR